MQPSGPRFWPRNGWGDILDSQASLTMVVVPTRKMEHEGIQIFLNKSVENFPIQVLSFPGRRTPPDASINFGKVV